MFHHDYLLHQRPPLTLSGDLFADADLLHAIADDHQYVLPLEPDIQVLAREPQNDESDHDDQQRDYGYQVTLSFRYFLIILFIMVFNIFICFYLVSFHGFTSVSVTRYMVFKETFNLMLGNFSDLQMGFGSDEFTEYDTFQGVLMFCIFIISTLIL